jgi:hypothetical protein
MIKYQVKFHEETRDKLKDLYTQLNKAKSGSRPLDPSKSAEYADAIKLLGRTLKCTCF